MNMLFKEKSIISVDKPQNNVVLVLKSPH